MAIGGMLAGVGGGAVASIVVKATTADAERALKNLGNRIAGTEKATSGMMGAMRVAGPIILGVGIAAAGAAVKLAMIASEADTIRASFRRMSEEGGRAANDLLQSLTRASAGTISQVEMMKQANRAFLLIGTQAAEQLPRMMEIARGAAQDTGESVQFMFESIVLGIGRQSRMILDNLGIIVDAESAYKKYAAELGKTVDQLTDAERKQAFLNEAMRQGEEKFLRAGERVQTFNERMQMMNAQLEDAKVQIGRALLPVVVKLTEWLARAATTFSQLIFIMRYGMASISGNEQAIEQLKAELLEGEEAATAMAGGLGDLEAALGETGIAAEGASDALKALQVAGQQSQSAFGFLVGGGGRQALEDFRDAIQVIGTDAIPSTVAAYADWNTRQQEVLDQIEDTKLEIQNVRDAATIAGRDISEGEQEYIDALETKIGLLEATHRLIMQEQPKVNRVLNETGEAMMIVAAGMAAVNVEAKARATAQFEEDMRRLGMLMKSGRADLDDLVLVMGEDWVSQAIKDGAIDANEWLEALPPLYAEWEKVRDMTMNAVAESDEYDKRLDALSGRKIETTVTTIFTTVGRETKAYEVAGAEGIFGAPIGTQPGGAVASPFAGFSPVAQGSLRGTGRLEQFQKGFHGTVRTPTWVLVGEHGDERVDVSPLGSRALGLLVAGGGGGSSAPPPEGGVLSTQSPWAPTAAGSTGGEPQPAGGGAAQPSTQSIVESAATAFAAALPELKTLPMIAAAAAQPPPKVVSINLQVGFQSPVQLADEQQMRRAAGQLVPFIREAIGRED